MYLLLYTAKSKIDKKIARKLTMNETTILGFGSSQIGEVTRKHGSLICF